MTYSFGIKAENKAAAKEAVAAKFDEAVVGSQPIHARDRAAVLTNAHAAIGLLADDDTKDVAVSCGGYVSWSGEGAESRLTSVSISCTASHTARLLTPGQ